MAGRFASLGCKLVLWDINEKGNQETLDMVQKLGATGRAYTVDLSNREKIYETASQVYMVLDFLLML